MPSPFLSRPRHAPSSTRWTPVAQIPAAAPSPVSPDSVTIGTWFLSDDRHPLLSIPSARAVALDRLLLPDVSRCDICRTRSCSRSPLNVPAPNSHMDPTYPWPLRQYHLSVAR